MQNPVLCDDGKERSLHGVSGSHFVYADGRRVYGYISRLGDSSGTVVFHASTTGKYRHLVQPQVLAEVS